jgi:hypothetical protein
MTGILDSAQNTYPNAQAKHTNCENLFGFSRFSHLGPDQTVAENRLISAAVRILDENEIKKPRGLNGSPGLGEGRRQDAGFGLLLLLFGLAFVG